MALRAAFLNAYDEMASTLVGEKISSYSEAENFVLTKDVNRSQVCAAVYGAHVPNPGIDAGNRGWGWDKDGNAFVKLQLDARKARDILGQRIRYQGPNVIEVIGRGSPVDTMKQESNGGSMVRDGGSKTEYRSLDIPGGGELKGKATEPVKTQ